MAKIEETINKYVVNSEDLELTDSQRHSISSTGFSQAIRALLQNWRQGTVGCKDRSEVAFANRKPWKQKGTGRARAGSLRSPLWRKGGVTFGPQPRTRTLKVPKNMRRQVYNNLLWKYLADNKIISLPWVSQDIPKTSYAYKALRSADLHDKKIILFLRPEDHLSFLSFANIPNVNILLFDQANAYDLANSEYWVVLDKDKAFLKEMVSLWI